MSTKTALFFFAFLYLLASTGTTESHPPRPFISETFSAEVDVFFKDDTSKVFGGGHIGRDYHRSKEVIDVQITKNEYPNIYTYHRLKRYDMKKVFVLIENMRIYTNYCRNYTFSEPLEKVWGWIRNAVYVGMKVHDGHKFEVWNHTINGIVNNSVWVNQTSRHAPYRYILEIKDQNVTVVTFKTFKPRPPDDPSDFDVPKYCLQTTGSLPIKSPDILHFSRDFDDHDED